MRAGPPLWGPNWEPVVIRGNAQDFLLTILTNGPVLQSKIIARGQEYGFSLDQLKRAKRALEIKCIKAGGLG